ncbi:hypothetical protein HK098_001208 [Nowakowskiella sp. JEL0407]|nr:hypothetical protein HK098_001208 [Nowakowskiella sp. JEL0407]
MAPKGKKNRKQNRKKQSLQDKSDNFWRLGRQVNCYCLPVYSLELCLIILGQLSDPLREYREFIAGLRLHGFGTSDFINIPVNLIDLTATLIASLISGRDVSLSVPSTSSLQNLNFDFDSDYFSDRIPASPKPTAKSFRKQNSQSVPNLSTSPTSENHEPTEDETSFSFIRKIIKRTRLSCSTFLLGLLFVFRIRQLKEHTKGKRFTGNSSESTLNGDGSPVSKRRKLETDSTIPTFIASVICADKILYDSTYTNQDWSEFTDGSYTLEEINTIERDFLRRIDYNLFVTDKEFDHFLSYLDIMIFFRQMYRWSSLTYRDLLRLSFNLSPEYLNRRIEGKSLFASLTTRSGSQSVGRPRLFTTMSDAIMLLIRILLRQIIGYVAMVAVASVIVAVVVKNASTGVAVKANSFVASMNESFVLIDLRVDGVEKSVVYRVNNQRSLASYYGKCSVAATGRYFDDIVHFSSPVVY